MNGGIDDATLGRIERELGDGITSAQILDVLGEHGVPFSEATLRKWVQVGLLPRSVRVGKKGKHQGSQGMYPSTIVRQIVRIKEMMEGDRTIEQIQREFLFARGDIEELERVLGKIFESLSSVAKARKDDGIGRVVMGEIVSAKALAKELVGRIEAIEKRLQTRAKLARTAVS